jgi:hypothetical protein
MTWCGSDLMACALQAQPLGFDCSSDVNPFTHEFHLNNIYTLTSYSIKNVLRLHCEHELVDVV